MFSIRPVGWPGTHITCGTALQARLHWEERVCSTGRASAQVDTKKLRSGTDRERTDIAKVGQVTPGSTQDMGRVPAKSTGDKVADKRVTAGASCGLGHSRHEASSPRDGAVSPLGATEGTARCCISSSVLLQVSCCCKVRLRDCQGTAGMAGTGTRGARGSSALKTEPPACCYLLNNRGVGRQPERNVIPASPGKTSELPAAAVAPAGQEPSSPPCRAAAGLCASLGP